MINNKKLIMTIEDDVSTRMTILLILEMAGYEVVEASNAQDALKRLHAGNRPDLVLVGWHMGGGELDGRAFLAAQRDDDRFAALPVVVCSGSVDSNAAIGLGAKAVLSKPFAVDDLLMLVKAHSLPHRKPHSNHP